MVSRRGEALGSSAVGAARPWGAGAEWDPLWGCWSQSASSSRCSLGLLHRQLLPQTPLSRTSTFAAFFFFLIYCRTFWGWWAGAAPSTAGSPFPHPWEVIPSPHSLAGCPGWRSSPCAFLLPRTSAVCTALLALQCPACPFPGSGWM